MRNAVYGLIGVALGLVAIVCAEQHPSATRGAPPAERKIDPPAAVTPANAALPRPSAG